MGIFAVTFGAMFLGIVLILLLKKTSPPSQLQPKVQFENPDDQPIYFVDRHEFREKCLEFLSKFNLEYKHSVWADDNELEVALEDETPVVGGLYLALCIFNPSDNRVDSQLVTGFLDTIKGEGAARGILITTGYFSDEAIRCSESEPVELVNRAGFLDYLKRFGID